MFYQGKVVGHQALIGYRHRPKSSGGILGENDEHLQNRNRCHLSIIKHACLVILSQAK